MSGSSQSDTSAFLLPLTLDGAAADAAGRERPEFLASGGAAAGAAGAAGAEALDS